MKDVSFDGFAPPGATSARPGATSCAARASSSEGSLRDLVLGEPAQPE